MSMALKDELKVECICCRECYDLSELGIDYTECKDATDRDSVYDFATYEGAEFDCPDCGERQYLSDCELF